MGKNCPNVSNDVKLVQYLLMAFYDKGLSYSSVYTKPKGNMKVDGVCGPVTLNWILKFQLDVIKRNPGSGRIADNRIDRIRNKDLYGSFRGEEYILALLNRFTQKVNSPAYFSLPYSVPLENSGNVPPPSADVVKTNNPLGAVQKAASQMSEVKSRVFGNIRV